MRRASVVAAVAAVVFSLLPAVPAAATAGGEITFNGTAQLPVFPCSPPPPFGSGPCSGTMSGGWAGHAAGTVAGGEFDVTWATLTGLSADFRYYEVQCIEPSTVLGQAFGSGQATAGPGSIRGSWQGTSGLPHDVTEVRLGFQFQWTRVGTTAVITLSPFALDVYVAGLGWHRAASAALPGTATFVPQTVDNVHPPTCAQPLTGVRGLVAGHVTFVG